VLGYTNAVQADALGRFHQLIGTHDAVVRAGEGVSVEVYVHDA